MRLILLIGFVALLPAEERFSGTTPADLPILRLLKIDAPSPPPEVIHWTLLLASEQYTLLCTYGLTAPNEPGLARPQGTARHSGTWTQQGDRLELEGLLHFRRIGGSVIHVLDAPGHLASGNGGWSYSLNHDDHGEALVDAQVTTSMPTASHRMLPLPAGPDVAVFEGRTPCQGVAREIGVTTHAGCAKAKWRIVLWETTRRFRLEGSLFRDRPAEGTCTLDGDHYRLALPQGSLRFRRHSDVLFLLDSGNQPLTGNTYFNYTLDRRRK